MFFPHDKTSLLGQLHAKEMARKWTQYLWTWYQSVVPNDIFRYFLAMTTLRAKFQIPVARQ